MEPAGLPPQGGRDRGPGKQFTGPNVPFRRVHLNAPQAPPARSDEKGFTLIELLVVILIIGILAAIALPAFLNQRGKAQDTEAKSAARTAQTAMETLYTDEQDYSATKAAARGDRAGPQGGRCRDLVVTSGAVGDATDGYAVDGRRRKTGQHVHDHQGRRGRRLGRDPHLHRRRQVRLPLGRQGW